MKTHKLPSHGATRTKCGVSIPQHLRPGPLALVWAEPDGADLSEPCAKCDFDPARQKPAPPPPPAPSERRAFTVFAIHRGQNRELTWTAIGGAVMNRDGSIGINLVAGGLHGDHLHLRPLASGHGAPKTDRPVLLSRSGEPFKVSP